MAVKRRAFKSHHYQRRIAPGRGAKSSCALALVPVAGSMLAAALAVGYGIAQVVA